MGGPAPVPPGGAPPGNKPITGSPQTMAAYALSIDPRTGLPRGESPPASVASVIALVCGALICLGPLTAFPAIIAGFIARKAARDEPHRVGGSGLAIAGICLGIFNLLVTSIVLVAVIMHALS